jgi:tRNA pseudouridine13 synthase
MSVITGGIFGGATKITAPSEVTTEGEDLDIEAGLSPEEELRNFLFSCLEKSEDCVLNFTACTCPDKISRTKLHQIVRKYLSLFVESEALEVDGAKFILLIAKHKIQKGKSGDWRNRNQWPDKLGNYLQFTLFKENIDSMSAAHYISKILLTKVDSIQFAGTKDKRAVTSQKVTMYRRKPSDLAKLNRFNLAPYIRVGDFEYVNEPLKLGGLSGNNFGIIMRDLDSSPDIVKRACEAIGQSGFINYFGLQRFGSGGTKSHISGLALLKQDWKLAVEYLFAPREGDRPEIGDMKEAFGEKDYKRALSFCPYKMPTEKAVLESLIRSPVDFAKAYSTVTKNQWLMCLHAYQSYIWNMSASERVHKYGLVCIEGDLVSVGASGPDIDVETVDDNCEDGEGSQSVEDTQETASKQVKEESKEDKIKDNSFQNSKNRSEIRVLTSEDIAANIFTIKDVILPLPGHNIKLPTNDIGSFYLNLLSKDGISLEFFAKCLPAHRMNGAYRRLIQMPTDFEWNYFEYNDPNEELVPTESSYLRQMSMDKSSKRRDDARNFEIPLEYSLESKPYSLTNLSGNTYEEVPGKYGPGDGTEIQEVDLAKKASGKLKGLQMKFTLPPGTYATMMLREISKHSTHSQYQAQLTAIASASVATSNSVTNDDNIVDGKRSIVEELGSSKKSRIE